MWKRLQQTTKSGRREGVQTESVCVKPVSGASGATIDTRKCVCVCVCLCVCVCDYVHLCVYPSSSLQSRALCE